MNASVRLLEQTLPSTVHLHASVPEEHPSVPVLGAERAGTGTIVDADGLIITVNYVVLGARQATVTTIDGQEWAAEVVAQDFATGVAVLRASGSDGVALPMRPTDDLAVGEDVFIAASVGDAGRRAASGGVTAITAFDANWEYSLDQAIFTSAMNPGLGGGPLVDTQGRILGIVSLNLNEIGRFSLGIPIACFRDHRDELLQFGRRRSRASRAWLGLFCYTLREHVVVAGLVPGAPGERGGLAHGDVLLGIDRRRIATRREFYEYLWSRPAGSVVALELYRKDEILSLEVPSVDVEDFFA